MTNDRPNIVLVHCHDLGTYLGCYGVDVETPHIDSLATDGIRFDRHFVTAPQCSPSRASLFTGRHPHQNGMLGLAHADWELGPDERVLPDLLCDAGYETHLFGLQHITEYPDQLGYDHIHTEQPLTVEASPAVHETARANAVADEFASVLESDGLGDPFFASVGFFELHRVEENGGFGFEGDRYDAPAPEDVAPLEFLPDRPGIRSDIAEINGMLNALDEATGTVLEALDEAGVADETLVVFTTEHGLAMPRAKGCCFDPGIEAALLMRYPSRIDGGQTVDDLISNVDVFATLIAVADAPVPETQLAGERFTPLLFGDAGDEGDEGNAGDAGDAGDEGNAGDTDDAGDEGNAGDTDDAGDEGNAGDTDDAGDEGNAGDTDDAGDEGNAGDADDTDDAGDEGDKREKREENSEDSDRGDYEPRDRIFAGMTWHDRYNPMRAIRTERWKYVRNFWHLPHVYMTTDIYCSAAGREMREEFTGDQRAYEELYDLEADPLEQENLLLADTPDTVDTPDQHGSRDVDDVRTRLRDDLVDWMTETDDPLLDGPVVPSDWERIHPEMGDDR
ncbi:sulfatase [Natrialba magadii ATCC 43099]|uniref:Sulfatase n=1 Tax=Natrialba magadii (strain ATCC 43099 / DSM 3394 / CCM 3739 / CIP 104546 / IAM 13178 / JCM 8861 / NBRC 102185 / NCIMB 2190 / MS3) TaxID=547559 RepID=D3SSY7_NATMM|nr:sulfatase [Natrialba magadii]ADD04933.2 sulfatase [Natrialba magadii ATCC 43099]